jgi:hypothetical protein
MLSRLIFWDLSVVNGMCDVANVQTDESEHHGSIACMLLST